MAAVKQKIFTVSKTPIVGERQFVLNVRSEILKKPIYKRGKKAVTAIREMTAKAMHTNPKHVKICGALNLAIWSSGKHNPQTRYKVHSVMHEDFALVELQGTEFPKQKEKAKAQDTKTLKEKIAERLASKQQQSKTTEVNKELKKEELSMEKKEHAQEAHSHQAPGKVADDQRQGDKVKGTVTQDKKKGLGEQ